MRRTIPLFLFLGLFSLLSLAQTAELLIWRMPSPDALPSALSLAPDGTIYIAEFRARKIARLDPTTGELLERGIDGEPLGIHAPDANSIFYTLPLQDTIEYTVFRSGSARWGTPTTGSWPETLIPAPSALGGTVLWFNERQAGKVARLSLTRIAVTLPLFYPERHPLTPERQTLTPDVTRVSPRHSAGNPLLPPPIALVTTNSMGAITEWDVLGTGGGYVEDLALGPTGTVWFTTDAGALNSLDPNFDTVLFYSLPSGVKASGVVAAADGTVWFTDTGTPALGRLDPTTGAVTLWPIPGGQQPIDLALDPSGNVWFIDREAELVGYLRPSTGELAIYTLPPNSHPVDLALAGDGTAWFVCERGNYVASLSLVPVLGPPPISPSTDAARILGYSITRRGNHATIQVAYSYDGSYGFPALIGLYVLPNGQGFAYSPYRIVNSGTGIGTIELTYNGAGTTTEAIKLVIYLPGGQTITERLVDFRTTWTP